MDLFLKFLTFFFPNKYILINQKFSSINVLQNKKAHTAN